ncbi:hypothetical protein KIN20_017650 [Parelaphostrongylus tenuis]|uniref:Uncharacterized protein n=1 Tax=Parelaphostrongylus tenuis TaxID=148309 RepID=A0AAD5QQX5_PARTN|nr:hypothetical protein KIN20_017650 [Parelaphostrongylus tenuis]
MFTTAPPHGTVINCGRWEDKRYSTLEAIRQPMVTLDDFSAHWLSMLSLQMHLMS